MPIPKSGQTEEEFVKKFMSDAEMIDKYPDEKQRYAVCMSEWEKKNEMSKDDNIEYVLDKAVGELKAVSKKQKIKVFPKGEFYIEKLARKLSFNDEFFADINIAFSAPTLSKPVIDKDHGLSRGQSESYGDIISLSSQSDGLYAEIQLNKTGIELIKNNQYKYISPAWGKTTDTEGKIYKSKLVAISLTNYPALEGALPDLQSQIQLSKTVVNINFENGGNDQMELAKLNELFQLSENDSIDVIADKVVELQKSITEKESKLEELSNEIGAMKAEKLQSEAVSFVTDQIKLGKMHPAIQDIVINRYILNKEDVIAEYSLIPEPKKPEVNPTIAVAELSKVEMEIAEKSGYDINNPEDVKSFKLMRKNLKNKNGGSK